jgi:hypothetical protein
MDVDPIELQTFLKGVDYPADREELAATAEGNGAPQEVVNALREAHKESFDGPAAVEREIF